MSRVVAMAALVSIFLVSTAQVRQVHEDDEHARGRIAAELAIQLTAALPRMLERFSERRRALPLDDGTMTYPAPAVRELLDATEAELLGQLEHPEVVPLRAKTEEVFRAARRELGLESTRSTRHALPPGPAFAAHAPLRTVAAAQEKVDRRITDTILGRIGDFLSQMMDFSQKDKLLVDVCVVSEPEEKAGFEMATPGYPDKKYQQLTPGKLVNVFRGPYVYSVKTKVKKKDLTICQPPPAGKQDRCRVDLWEASEPTLHCSFSREDCIPDEGWPKACESRGRRR